MPLLPHPYSRLATTAQPARGLHATTAARAAVTGAPAQGKVSSTSNSKYTIVDHEVRKFWIGREGVGWMNA